MANQDEEQARNARIAAELKKAAFAHARAKDAEGGDGITSRTDFMLDQMNEAKETDK